MKYNDLIKLPPVTNEAEAAARVVLFRKELARVQAYCDVVPVEIFGLGVFKTGEISYYDVLEEIENRKLEELAFEHGGYQPGDEESTAFILGYKLGLSKSNEAR